MTLAPTGGLIATIRKGFELDPEATSVLVDEAVSNLALDLIEDNEPLVQVAIADEVLEAVAKAKRALGRTYVGQVAKGAYPSPESVATAEWLTAVEGFAGEVRKEWITYTNRQGRQARQYRRRDERGRFSRFVDVQAKSDPMGVKDKRKVSPHLTNLITTNDSGQLAWSTDDDAVKERVGRHQGQWEQATEYAEALHNAFGRDADDVLLMFSLTRGGEGREVSMPLADVKRGMPAIEDLNPLEDDIISVRLEAAEDADSNTVNDVHRFNAMGYVGGQGIAALSGVSQGGWTKLLGRYAGGTVEDSGTQQLFNRLTGAGEVLSALPGGEKAAKWAALVGQYGPQAEEVLGPYVRLAAYRYRGTEKSPDPELRAAFESDNWAALRQAADDRISSRELQELTARAAESTIRGQRDAAGNRGGQNNTLMAAARLHAGRSSGDQFRLNVANDVAVAHLVNALPDEAFTAKLSEASGHVLPSQGILIDADGDLVAQAVGYADDHYLPFNLKNIAALRGGQYVRTRVAGGLTGEDIYTAVQAGARKVTVVSANGVYSLELDPNFRGARGNSDKARSMYERYLKILDAVDASGLYLKDIDPAEKQKIAQRAEMMTGKTGRDLLESEEYKGLLQQARRAAVALPAVKVGDQMVPAEDYYYQQAQETAVNEPGFKTLSVPAQSRKIEEIYEDLIDDQLSQRVQALSLNSEGYRMALETLKEQFPYFIREVRYEPLKNARKQQGFFSARGLDTTPALRARMSARDTGYVRPGGLRPASVQSGFYRVDGGMSPKRKRAAEPATETTEGLGVTGSGGAGDVPAVPGSPASGGGAQAPGTTEAAQPVPKTGLTARLEALAQLKADEAPKVAAQVGGVIQRNLPQIKGALDIDSMSLQQLRAVGDTQQIAQWALQKKPGDLAEILLANEDVVEALSDPEAVAEAIEADWRDEGFEDKLATRGKTVQDVADEVASLVQTLSDMNTLSSPFVMPATDPVKSAFYRGGKPQLFGEFANLQNSEQVFGPNGALSMPDYQDLQETMERLGWVNGGEYLPARNVAEMSKIIIAGLNQLYLKVEGLQKVRASAGRVDEGSLVALAQDQGYIPDDFAEAVWDGEPTDADLAPDALQRKAMDIQRAWSLLTVERAVQALDGGGVRPKAGEGLRHQYRPPQSAEEPEEELAEVGKAARFRKGLAARMRLQVLLDEVGASASTGT